MSLARKLVSGVALPLLLAACEEAVEPGNTLNKEESVALMKGVGVTLGQVLEDSTLTVFASPDSIIARCPSGGQTRWHSHLTKRTGDTTLVAVRVQINPAECSIAADGIQLTIDGAGYLRYFMSLQIIAATPEVNFSGYIRGGLDWTLDHRMGYCPIDLRLDAVPDLINRTLTGVYRGWVCYRWVEIDVNDAAAFLMMYL
ncbi:MAG: hypothetical protein OXL34_11835 [Gemmatimonadota bacterium]|nr:hypothetical protein [Gemmatimonadota bacterium]